MESLKIKSGIVHNIRPDIDYEEGFNDLILGEKASEVASKYASNPETDKIVAATFDWASALLGKKQLFEYLDSAPCSRRELIENLINTKNDNETNMWQRYYEMPSLEVRFEHLVDLMNKQQKVAEVIGQDTRFYPIAIPYRDILTKHMPSFRYNDAITERITHPNNSIAKLNGGCITISEDLLAAIRGKYKSMPPGIDYKHTNYAELHNSSNILGNYGLMIIGENLQSRQELKQLYLASGVDCRNAGLAEGIAIAKTGLLRIGDIIGLPKYIPNTKGDYYCGINVKMQYTNNPYDKRPDIYYGLWTQEGSQNCLLAITT